MSNGNGDSDDIEIVIKGKKAQPAAGGGSGLPPAKPPAPARPVPIGGSGAQVLPASPMPPMQPPGSSSWLESNWKALAVVGFAVVVAILGGFFAGQATRDSNAQISNRLEVQKQAAIEHETTALRNQKSDLSSRFRNTLAARQQSSYSKGRSEGYTSGFSSGQTEGFDRGKKEGFNIGYACGMSPTCTPRNYGY